MSPLLRRRGLSGYRVAAILRSEEGRLELLPQSSRACNSHLHKGLSEKKFFSYLDG